MPIPSTLLFLPGASGDTDFWRPLADRLEATAGREILAYPGFGGEPADPSIRDIDDLLERVLARIEGPTALIAQSMGGVLAVRAALARPERVTHLVLCVSSGGVDMAALGARDWRADFLANNGHLPDWFVASRGDLGERLPAIAQPSLLIWGDDDPYSPVAVGERLHGLLPDSALHVVPGGRHDLARVHAASLAPLVDAHLRR
ncbi:alpha/beta fold hydrolase [Burkholderia gladioli]|uniref:alpha/beta fold hydrolase n=1 Tax=Burkholderia gladioli TaxID=28095 RepID=UPI00163E0A52|nr:alpha/beta fold hydrolase [Burkholderia gladioli]MBJ9663997.1 alpha/beta fold hydrolase [Burkholderia gladioli]MBJ9675887.1 alpha/beta fold hydrolase [Burkholderia gladioli]MBU9177275.1 alpha/beta hydrolase [Burkholderia gladioli]MDN7464382.1 alpha/beta fold hydrolase [Burkholderia gladioli]